jgi:endonuclease/exonuclease/phosphatase family metal-dependent hydrolase
MCKTLFVIVCCRPAYRGLHYNAKKLKERFQAIAVEIKKESYDIVGLQEVWYKGDYRYLQAQLAGVLPHHYYFYNNVVGSGLCVFSKYPIVYVRSRSYITHTGVFECFSRNYEGKGEMFAGKGISYCRIRTPQGCIAVYNTHTECEVMHRACQLFEACQFISDTCGEDPAIFLGDFNMRETEFPYPILTGAMGFVDSFAGETTPTVNCVSNVFARKVNPPKRIDYILFSNNGSDTCGLKLLRRCLALSGKIPQENFNFSDHEGIEGTFSLTSYTGKGGFDRHPPIRKSFLGQGLKEEARLNYKACLRSMYDFVKSEKENVGMPLLVKTPAVSYSIWVLFAILMLSTIFVNLGNFPLVVFLATLSGFGICLVISGMLFDMKRQHTFANVLQEMESLMTAVDDSCDS